MQAQERQHEHPITFIIHEIPPTFLAKFSKSYYWRVNVRLTTTSYIPQTRHSGTTRWVGVICIFLSPPFLAFQNSARQTKLSNWIFSPSALLKIWGKREGKIYSAGVNKKMPIIIIKKVSQYVSPFISQRWKEFFFLLLTCLFSCCPPLPLKKLFLLTSCTHRSFHRSVRSKPRSLTP